MTHLVQLVGFRSTKSTPNFVPFARFIVTKERAASLSHFMHVKRAPSNVPYAQVSIGPRGEQCVQYARKVFVTDALLITHQRERSQWHCASVVYAYAVGAANL